MLIFTPRWNENGGPAKGKGNTLALYEASPGNLPDISSSSDRHMIPGPPLRPGTILWNAGSSFAHKGYRPLIHNLPSDDAAVPTDNVFIRYFGNLYRDDSSQVYPDHLAI